jgi:hypothetical protein
MDGKLFELAEEHACLRDSGSIFFGPLSYTAAAHGQ